MKRTAYLRYGAEVELGKTPVFNWEALVERLEHTSHTPARLPKR
jgi:hypothetical protein